MLNEVQANPITLEICQDCKCLVYGFPLCNDCKFLRQWNDLNRRSAAHVTHHWRRRNWTRAAAGWTIALGTLATVAAAGKVLAVLIA